MHFYCVEIQEKLFQIPLPIPQWFYFQGVRYSAQNLFVFFPQVITCPIGNKKTRRDKLIKRNINIVGSEIMVL